MWKSADYINIKDQVISFFKKKGVDKDSIVEYSSLTGVPLVVILEFLSEEFPEHKEFCDGKIRDLKEFYKIR